ncbi:PTS system protein [Klebsiella grimontii]|uniref:PTS system protein n=1 Tax=Klebsiella grimontii TaxID=2058152 RepID=A0A7H4P649_9ENTR|nr:PTS system protein [Klebsiella grimontii]
MFKNAFANLQKVGKSLMLPVSVLPIAGILLGRRFRKLQLAASRSFPRHGGSGRFGLR